MSVAVGTNSKSIWGQGGDEGQASVMGPQMWLSGTEEFPPHIHAKPEKHFRNYFWLTV